MSLPFKIARRYLFAKKTTNVINIISAIAVFGIAVGTAALLLVLSVFNGFEDLITGMYNSFNPDVKIVAKKGKTFAGDIIQIEELQALDGVAVISRTLEEIALFDYRDNRYIGVVKGVDANYQEVTNLDSTVNEGTYSFNLGTRPMAVLGRGMRSRLGVNVNDLLSPISVYMPKRQKSLFGDPFRRMSVYPAGTFNIQSEFNNRYVFTSLDFASKLLNVKNTVSALEVKLHPGYAIQDTYDKIREVMGGDFVVKNRAEQEATFFRLMKMEKWLSFAIVGLMMAMIAFNLIGALWMIVLDKKSDIAILKSMGADNRLVQTIFLNEGLLLCGLGLILGFTLAVLIYVVQKSVGLVSIPGNMVIQSYPISMRGFDFIIVALTVLTIGLLASFPPAWRTRSIPPIILEE